MNVITNEKKQAILNINVDIFRCYSFLNFNVSKEKQYSKTQKKRAAHVNSVLTF